MRTLDTNYYKRDFWIEENLNYVGPHYRLEKCARLVNKIAGGEQCDLPPFHRLCSGCSDLLQSVLAAVAACRTFRAPAWAASVARVRSGSHAGTDVSRRRICSPPLQSASLANAR